MVPLQKQINFLCYFLVIVVQNSQHFIPRLTFVCGHSSIVTVSRTRARLFGVKAVVRMSTCKNILYFRELIWLDIPNDQEISRGRSLRNEGNLKVGGDVHSELRQSTATHYSLIIIPSSLIRPQGCIGKYIPTGQLEVKIKTKGSKKGGKLMMRE